MTEVFYLIIQLKCFCHKTLIYTKTTAKIADLLYYTALKYQNNQNVTATGIFLIIFSDLDGCIASK